MSTQAIFSPIKVGSDLLNHRIVLAPLTRFRATPEAVPTDLHVEYYKQRATEGGLLITEATFIDRLAGGYPGAPGIYSKDQIEGWKRVTDAVHEKKGKIYMQLWHIGRVNSSQWNPNQEQIVSASNIPVSGKDFMTGKDYEVPHALEIDEIKTIVGWYRRAALNAVEAGFDGVEIHSANGYLLDQFINSNSNQRTDIYGGSIENRARFVLEVTDAVIEAVGAERTGIRFSPGGAFQDMKDDTPVETWSYITTQLQNNHPDMAYLHFIEARSSFMNDEVNSEDSLEPYRKIWKSTFITAGGFSTNVEQGINVAEKTGNLIAFGRTFIANPDLVERLRNNWELNKYNRATFYSPGAVGYTDYPLYKKD